MNETVVHFSDSGKKTPSTKRLVNLKKRKRCETCKFWDIRSAITAFNIDKNGFKDVEFEFSAGACKSPKLGDKFNSSDSAMIIIPSKADKMPITLLTGEDFCCCNYEEK